MAIIGTTTNIRITGTITMTTITRTGITTITGSGRTRTGVFLEPASRSNPRASMAVFLGTHNKDEQTRRKTMKKRFLIGALLIIALVSVGFAVGYGSDKPKSESTSFSATLTGGEVVPPVTTSARGEATFSVSKDGKAIKYKVTVSGIVDVTAAHIHMGKKGENGPPIALIKTAAKKGALTGTLSEGAITEKELMTSLQGKDLKALIEQIKAGSTYVNVHTKKYPDGEIRGEIK